MKKTLFRQTAVKTLLLAAMLFFNPCQFQAQDVAKRKIVDRATPVYPVLARNLALDGVVKLDALVAPNGSVKIVEIKGGHPVLAQAAVNAVRRWRWEPAARESHELVEVKFSGE